MNKIRYIKRHHWKYRLKYDALYDTGIQIDETYLSQYLQFSVYGRLIVLSGYCWDGPSGPTIDTKNSMRGSLIHDALYQLIREGILKESDRKTADVIFLKILREDGMNRLRSWIWYRAVRRRGGAYVKDDTLSAPKSMIGT